MRSVRKRMAAAGMVLLVVFIGRALAIGNEQFPAEWFWHKTEDQWAKHAELMGKPIPAFDVTDWVGEPLTVEQMRGKIMVVDLWATWCGPCKTALPHNNELVDKYSDRGVIVLAVCTADGQEKMRDVLDPLKPKFFAGRDASLNMQKEWRSQWYPTYALVDREGKVRAIGLRSNKVEEALNKLLEEQPRDLSKRAKADDKQKERRELHLPPWEPARYREGGQAHREQVAALEGGEPPVLAVEKWINSEPMALADLKGKVVMIDFWATESAPCLASISYTNQLYAKYQGEGLVIIGVCMTDGADKMADIVSGKAVKYPVVADKDGATAAAYKVDDSPDYYFIDRAGKLRLADCANGKIAEVIRRLLLESAEAKQ